MSEEKFYRIILYAWIGIALAVMAVLYFIAAPYGRHARKGWGVEIRSWVGWFLMEAPAPIGFTLFFFSGLFLPGRVPTTAAPYVFLGLWLTHYIHRSFIFPFRLRNRNRRMALLTVAMAVLFNLVNGYINGRWFAAFGPDYPGGWLADPRFTVGLALFVAGFVINIHSDTVLISLRAPGQTEYKIPRGGLFELVSCPNYLGEIVEWCGWALMTWSLPGLVFAVWTAANLAPRAWSNHIWMRRKFPEYPKARRALIPFIY